MLSVFPVTGPLPTAPPETGGVDEPDTAPVAPRVVLDPSGAVVKPEEVPVPVVPGRTPVDGAVAPPEPPRTPSVVNPELAPTLDR
jgi:hypothetical protein